MRPTTRLTALLSFLVVAQLGACDSKSDAPPRAGTSTAATAGSVVDSALPIDVLLARFRSVTPDTPTVLTGGAESPERLVRALLSAVSRRDTTALRSLVLSRGEFAWLYYPETKYTAPPYELGPDLVWIPLLAASEKGAGRLLARYGGSTLRFEALECPDRLDREGSNTITPGCTVRFAAADSAARTIQLFSSLLQRDGRYKFLSYANDL